MNNYTKNRSGNLLRHIQGLTGEEIANVVSYIMQNIPDDLERNTLIDDFGLSGLKWFSQTFSEMVKDDVNIDFEPIKKCLIDYEY